MKRKEEKAPESEKTPATAPEPYEPPKLLKFEKLEKLIVSGE
jgi:hypothetical protein